VTARRAGAAAALGLALAAPAGGAAVRAFEVAVSKAEVRLGEPFEWAVEVRHAPGERVALPAAAGLPGDPFHAEARGCAREERAGGAITRCTVSLALFALGEHAVPEIALAVEGPDGAETLAVPGPTVSVKGALDPAAPPESLVLRDPAPPVPLLVPTLRVLWWGLGLLAAAALAVLALRAWRRRRARASEPPPPLSPEERLARRLDELEALRLGARGHGREHVVRLSEAVREHLAARLGVPALDLTTAETVLRVEALADPRLDPLALRLFLEEADLVKFARAPAPEAACAAGLRFARALLEALRPAPAPPGGEVRSA
jgi:hypothetical protein